MSWFDWWRSIKSNRAKGGSGVEPDPIAARHAARERERSQRLDARHRDVTRALLDHITRCAFDRMKAAGVEPTDDQPVMLVEAVTEGLSGTEAARWFLAESRGGTASEDLSSLLVTFSEAVLACTRGLAERYEIGGCREITFNPVGWVDYGEFRAGVDPLLAALYLRIAWLLSGDDGTPLLEQAATARLARRFAPGGAPLLLGPEASDAHAKLTKQARAVRRATRE